MILGSCLEYMKTNKFKKDGTPSKQGEGGGRPSIFRNEFKDIKDLQDRINEYLDSCERFGTVPTKAGLMISLGIPNRERYSKLKKDGKYRDTLKATEMYIEEQWNQALRDRQAAGPIFYLKNAFKEEYKDKNETSIRFPKPILDGITPKDEKK